MPRCLHCDHEQPTSWKRCPVCDTPFAAGDLDHTMDSSVADATVVSDATETPPPSRSAGSLHSGLSTSSSRADERFAPGALLLDRYRIHGRLGAGAMGEVYRALDLTLDQEVALKFLPEEFGRDPQRRERFLQEVRLARQIAHPNVCRVYDVGEVDGHLFLSMEYVPGRDLSSVLRSIGRFPEEKALDIARQLCAGLAALHDRGVLHRDLKPANVMLDDDGQLRITDFGLAGVTAQVSGHDVRSGTPLYMAPEQLAGREVTERSDIYSLGLVLYEIFTGRKAFNAETLEQLKELRRSVAPSPLSSHVSEVDPAVERVVSRCLESEPERRPPSALIVATALPGGDPLAAALAMGETPSAELVSAAGGKGGIHPLLGLAFLAVALVGLVFASGTGARRNLVQHFDLDRSADALEERSRQLVADLGYDDRPADRFRAFARGGDMLSWLAKQDSTQTRWDRLAEMRPTPLLFWYRQSPTYLLTRNTTTTVTLSDPAPTTAGMIEVVLDANGRLVYFEAVPPERLDNAPVDSAAIEIAWDRLFAAAELDRTGFTETVSTWIPDVYASERHAWTGTYEAAGHEIEVTIEAGSVGSRPVYFRLHGPWSGDHRTVVERPSATGADVFIVLLLLAVLATGVILAVGHHRRGRTDMRGAGRLAVVLLAMPVVRWLFTLHHAPLPDPLIDRFFASVSMGALYAMLCLLLYLALEPFVRRIWPHVMIGWTRLLSGGWRDPMVGRSVLVGGALCGMSAIMGVAQVALARALDIPPPNPQGVNFYALATPRVLIGDLAMQVPNALFNALFFLMMLVLLRLLLRREWLAYIGFIVIGGGIVLAQMPDWRIGIVVGPMLAVLWLVTLVRGGMLAFVVGFYLWNTIQRFPLTLDFSQMYAVTSLMVLAGIVVLLVVGYSVALAGRSLLKER